MSSTGVEQHRQPEVAVARPAVHVGDFTLVLFGGLVLLLLIAAGELASFLMPLRVILGLAYVLFVPGYCLSAAIFPRRRDLDLPERLAVSFGLSVAVMPPIAFVLDKLPWGIRLWPIAASLALVVLGASAVAAYRRGQVPPAERFTLVGEVDVAGWWGAQPRASRVFHGVLGLAVSVAIVSMAAIVFLPKPEERLTEFYLLGAEGLAESFPPEVVVGQPVDVTMGIANREGVPVEYRVDVFQDEQRVGQAGPLRLEPGATVEQAIRFVPTATGDDVEIQLLLYRDGGSEAYRSLRLWLAVKEARAR